MMVTIIAAFSGPFLMVVIALLAKIALTKEQNRHKTNQEFEPFVVSEYFSRMEQAALDILEAQEPIDQTIILWWGMDGLRMNEDGTLEWISRKKPEPVTAEVLYQPCQSIQNTPKPDWCNQTQDTDLQIRMALNAATMSQLRPPMPGYFGYSPYMQAPIVLPFQQCCVQYPIQYPSYYYGGCCRIN